MIILAAVKLGLSVLTSVGGGLIVENAIKASAPTVTTISKKIAMTVGGFAITGIISDKASEYMEEQFDKAKGLINKVFRRKRKVNSGWLHERKRSRKEKQNPFRKRKLVRVTSHNAK